MKRSLILVVGCLAALSLVAGCAKNYVVTQPLAHALATPATISVATITDGLPAEMPADKKPSAGDMEKLQRCLVEAIAGEKVGEVAAGGGDALYEVRGSLLEYK